MEKSSHLPKTSKRGRQWNRALSCLGRGDLAPGSWGRERLVSGWEGEKNRHSSPSSQVLEEGWLSLRSTSD